MFPLPSALGNPFLPSAGGGPTSYINSIQSFTITIGSTATSATTTISSVNTANAVIFFGGTASAESSTTLEYSMARVTLTNATTVTANRNAQNGNTLTVYGTVVEFTGAALNSAVQYGTISIGSAGTSNTAAISSVSTSNAVVLYLGLSNSSTITSPQNVFATVALTNATTVTAARNTSGTAALTVGYCVAEFASGIINSIQPRSLTLTSATTSDTDTITSVNTSNALVLYNGCTTNTATYNAFLYNLQLSNGTTVTLSRNGTSTSSRTIKYTVLEFVSGVLNSLQRGTLGVTSTTTATAGISSVNTSKAVCNWTGFLTNATTPNKGWMAAELLDATDVEVLTGTSGSTATAGYEIVEFK